MTSYNYIQLLAYWEVVVILLIMMVIAIIEITIFSTYNYSFLTLFPSILIESGFLSDPDPEKPGSGTLNSE